MVFQPSVVVTRTRTSVPASWTIALTVSELPVTASPSERHVVPPSSEIETIEVSASPSASLAVHVTFRSAPSSTRAGVSTLTTGAVADFTRVSRTSAPRRMRSERAAASAGTRSEKPASSVTIGLSPLAVSLPIGPSALTAPNERVCSTAPPASSCSKVSGPLPSASASPGSSHAAPVFTAPLADTEPVKESVRRRSEPLDHARGERGREVVPRLLGHPAPGRAGHGGARGVELHEVQRRGGHVAPLGDPEAGRGLVVEVVAVRARDLGPAEVVRELVGDDPAARVLALDDRRVQPAALRSDAHGLGEAVDLLAREPALRDDADHLVDARPRSTSGGPGATSACRCPSAPPRSARTGARASRSSRSRPRAAPGRSATRP